LTVKSGKDWMHTHPGPGWWRGVWASMKSNEKSRPATPTPQSHLISPSNNPTTTQVPRTIQVLTCHPVRKIQVLIRHAHFPWDLGLFRYSVPQSFQTSQLCRLSNKLLGSANGDWGGTNGWTDGWIPYCIHSYSNVKL
jgi:hypothetical protein